MTGFSGQDTPLAEIRREIDEIDDAVEAEVTYAFSEQLGYLTACPTNLGTGMRASAMMHLPALIISNQMEKVVRAVNQLGMVVRESHPFGDVLGHDAARSVLMTWYRNNASHAFALPSLIACLLVNRRRRIRLTQLTQMMIRQGVF